MYIKKVEKIVLTCEEVELLETARDLLEEIYTKGEDDVAGVAYDAILNIDDALAMCDHEEEELL